MGDFNELPEGCIANVLSLTCPPDACRLSSISTFFKSAAEADAVWERFLPPDYGSIISRSACSSIMHCSSKKELFLSLCDNPILIDNGNKSFWLEKRSGKKCYMLSARDLKITWSDSPYYWRWISLPDIRFAEVAELIMVCWLEIRGKINTKMLSPKTLYAAFLVFKVTTGAHCGFHQPVEVEIGLVGRETRKQMVYLDIHEEEKKPLFIIRRLRPRRYLNHVSNSPASTSSKSKLQCPNERTGGWYEIELGDFYNEGEHEEGELEMAVLETKGGHWKAGLIVQGIEIRPKKSSKC